MTPILNPEPGRFICRGPMAAMHAHIIEEIETARGMVVSMISADGRILDLAQGHEIERRCQQEIADADVIIDVIP